MKIGIVTYWNSTDNYGQIMQGLALQRYLRSLGHDPFIIRFHEEIPPTSIREKISKLSPLYLGNISNIGKPSTMLLRSIKSTLGDLKNLRKIISSIRKKNFGHSMICCAQTGLK